MKMKRYNTEQHNTEFDQMIREAVKLPDSNHMGKSSGISEAAGLPEPSAQLNNALKAELYRREAVIRKAPATRSVVLWYVPMILNLITFAMLAGAALILISNVYLAFLAAGACLYLAAAGIVITVIGVKRTNIKEEITLHIQKRGALT